MLRPSHELTLQEPTDSIRVRHGYCPISRRDEYSVWDGHQPSIPIVTFLRSQFESEKETVACKAYALANFLRWLRERALRFWKIEYGDIQDYKLSLLARAREREISYDTARRYLRTVYELCVYWQEPSARQPVLFKREPSRGPLAHLTHLRRRLPKEFLILAPKSHRPNETDDKLRLPPNLYEAVWRYLERARPARPPILTWLLEMRQRPASNNVRSGRTASVECCSIATRRSGVHAG